MKINSNDFRMKEGEKVDLKKCPTAVEPAYNSKKQYRNLLENHVEQLSLLQNLHYASNRYAVLLIFQAMDAAGKDGTIRHVMSGVNPQGCEVFSFKQPSPVEWSMTFSGVPPNVCLNAGGSESSIGRTMKRCLSSACIRNFSTMKASTTKHRVQKHFGGTGISQSWILKITCIGTEHGS